MKSISSSAVGNIESGSECIHLGQNLEPIEVLGHRDVSPPSKKINERSALVSVVSVLQRVLHWLVSRFWVHVIEVCSVGGQMLEYQLTDRAYGSHCPCFAFNVEGERCVTIVVDVVHSDTLADKNFD